MKDLKIYSVDEMKEPLLLRLAYEGDDVVLIAVNDKGVQLTGGRLLALEAGGLVYLHKGINEKFELPLDADGRLKIVGSKEKSAVTFSDDDLANLRSAINILRVKASSGSSLAGENTAYEGLDVIERMVEALGLPISKLRKS